MSHDPGIAAAAADIADRLTSPDASTRLIGRGQSLADGAIGVALLHIERAHTGAGSWDIAHGWLTAAVNEDLLATPDAGLYLGVPAVAYTLHAAAGDQTDRYGAAIDRLDHAVAALAHRRVDHAHSRLTRRALPTLAEFDVIGGLTGIGAHLLRHAPNDDALPRILAYLVRLTHPLHHDGVRVPGWWTLQDPHAESSAQFPGGHSNHGLAHGITGPLALLALAHRRDIVVDGHREAIERICAWLDTWRQHDDTGVWWPQWTTRAEHRTGRTTQPGPLRPSWCYGTPGVTRAQQLAALATGDTTRQRMAEDALAGCLDDSHQLGTIIDTSLCHGWAGLLQTTRRAAADAGTPALAARLPPLTARLLHHATTAPPTVSGLLEGAAGVGLALHAAAREAASSSGWDTCLLIA